MRENNGGNEDMPSHQQNPMNSDEVLSIRELAYISGTTQRIIQRLISFELVRPLRTDPEVCFQAIEIHRVRRLVRLHRQLGVSWSSMELVIDLLDKIEELKKE